MRRVATFVAATLSVLTANCTCTASHESENDAGAIDAGATDAGPDVFADVRVEVNCADPVNWGAAPERDGYFGAGGGPCDPPQYPLSAVSLGPRLLAAERTEIRSSCWRVEEAPDDSGWELGQTFSGSTAATRALFRGFDRPVVVSGRLYRADGTLAYSVAPIEVALDDAEFLDVGTEEVVALLRPDAWATRFAIHTSDEVVATQEVIAGSGGWGYFNTLHREGDEFLVRFWRLDPGLVSVDVPLGAGERAILAEGGGAAAIDETLLLFGNTSISRRLSLPEPRRYSFPCWRLAHSPRDDAYRGNSSSRGGVPSPVRRRPSAHLPRAIQFLLRVASATQQAWPRRGHSRSNERGPSGVY